MTGVMTTTPTAPISFAVKQLQPIITLASDAGTSFNGNNTAQYDGLRVRANVSKGGSPQLDHAEIRIWGMPLSDMNAVSRLGKPLTFTRANVITLNAGDLNAGMSQVFTGTINMAYVDFSDPPEAFLYIQAYTRLIETTTPVTPSSFPGTASISTIGNAIASKMGLGFINSGVTAQFMNAYFTGSAVDQMRKAAEAANCNMTLSGGSDGNHVEVWPKGQARGAMGPLISATTGLVGYPSYVDVGVEFKAEYVPGLTLGQAFTLQSSLKLAIETWYTYSLDLDLGCNDPDGDNPWFMDITATSIAQSQASSGNSTGSAP